MSIREIQAETHVHDMSPFHFLARLNASGLGNYPSRAMVCAGTTVTGADSGACMRDLLENFRHLRRVKIGTDNLILVSGDNVMMGLMRDENLLGLVRASILERMRPLRLYLTRSMDPLVKKLGLSMDDILTPDWTIAERFDDKLQVRRLGAELNCDGFAPWRSVAASNRARLREIRAEVFAEADRILPTDVVFLKRPDFDGGEGILEWNDRTTPEELDRFCDEHLPFGLLMEAGYPKDRFDMEEASVQVEIHEDRWDPLYPSLQIARNNAHAGNEILIGERLIDRAVWTRMLEIMRPLSETAVVLGLGRKRPRLIGFDFLIVRCGGVTHVFNNEINARGTAPQYAYAVAMQAAPRLGGRAAVIMENLLISKKRDHYGLEVQLKDLLWDGESSAGLLIGNAGCISHGKVTLFSIGSSLEEARALHHRIPAL